MDIGNGEFWNGDCLELMADIPDGSVDMVLCDLPYGTTACKWDTVIPFAPLWEHYWRVAKPNAAIVLTAAQPFTSALVMSEIRNFKYGWIWRKNTPTGMAFAKYQPMRDHEDVLVFCRGRHTYNKQYTKSKITDRKLGGKNTRGKTNTETLGGLSNENYTTAILSESVNPRTVIEFDVHPRSKGTLHPTQKPVALFEYLIKTYTNPGEMVLDNCAGSGTTAIAAERTNRKWICIEQDEEYYEKACERVKDEIHRLI